ncbi:redoxin domain-containing protein [Simiduia curdlanivorans]|uniref:Redoxin family protein n=1 Tax=Simiduia curdlanivorans TaxID=1492769 RepID=A0ABV8V5Y9_9GAMM|nr:redoxin family protein [Simiduia curdlanivorans]MDN3638390.1 redoxin domain-containing protein [Simiduia curdlanivorans]
MITRIAILLGALFATSLASARVAVNEPAPDFTLTSSTSETISLSQYKGKMVILEWTNHLCPYVQKHYDSGNMQKLQKQYTDEGVVWLSIISSATGKQGYVTAAEANSLTENRNASPNYVLFDTDGKVGKAYGAQTTPHMYVIDKDGVLRYQGAIDSIKSANQADIVKAENYLTSAMQSLAKGEVVKRPVTAPYGCSVKYE